MQYNRFHSLYITGSMSKPDWMFFYCYLGLDKKNHLIDQYIGIATI